MMGALASRLLRKAPSAILSQTGQRLAYPRKLLHDDCQNSGNNCLPIHYPQFMPATQTVAHDTFFFAPAAAKTSSPNRPYERMTAVGSLLDLTRSRRAFLSGRARIKTLTPLTRYPLSLWRPSFGTVDSEFCHGIV